MKKIVIGLALLIALALLGISCTRAPSKNAIDVDINTLLGDNFIASSDYGDKTIRTAGIVQSVGENSLDIGDAGNTLFITVNPSEKTKLTNIKKGQMVTIRGLYLPGLAGYVVNAVIESITESSSANNSGASTASNSANNSSTTNKDNDKYDKEIAEATKDILRNPNDTEAYYKRGEAYYGKDDYDKAIADYTEAIKLNPNDYNYWYSRAIAYKYKGDFIKANADFTEAIKLYPNPVSEWDYWGRGNLYYLKSDYDRAIADYNEALRLDPTFAWFYIDRGNAFLNKNDYDKAIADFDIYFLIEPNNEDNNWLAYGYRSVAYYKKGNYTQARADANKALQVLPEFYQNFNLEDIDTLLKQKGY
jgi:tetratricopeptide (TPR) repeat protein